MKKFLIIVNAQKDQGLAETKKICDYIALRGGSCSYVVSVDVRDGIQRVLAENVPEHTECILVLGGDGTLIRAARDTVTCGVPLIGINMGTLGYLCEMEVGSAFEGIDAILKDDYMLEDRIMLSGNALGRRCDEPPRLAFNDIVIHRTGPLSLVSLTVYVNGEYLNTFKGDGIIVSTPTGSTGYSLSAGGPIVDPKAQLILITPVNPHTLSSKSIVIGDQEEVVIEVGSRRAQHDEVVEVSFDGDSGFRLKVGDRIAVRRAAACAKILKLSKKSFLEILRRKMNSYQ